MTIEEKAKAYDVALEKARVFYNNEEARVGMTPIDLETIFPELSESEDEKMRKSIIYALRNGGFYDNDKTDEAIAWLEKQGCKDSQVTLPLFMFEDILALQCCMETVKKVQEDKDLYEKLKDLHGRVYDAYQLEKQEKTQQEPTSDHWQEQDNTMAFTLMRDIEQVSFISKEGKDERISWLNSLEDRFSNQESNKGHWQDVRERAAIAALEGLNANPEYALNSEDKIAIVAVNCADALVKKLKGV